jgi:hypothetical protein
MDSQTKRVNCYKENVKFRGQYKVNINKPLEKTVIPGVTSLEGITDVGLRIEKRLE